MRIRSWHIAALGVILQFAASIYILLFIGSIGTWLGLIVTFIAAYMLGYSIISVIPLVLLIFKKTLKIGGVIAILFGILGILSQVGIIAGVFFIVAGLLALVKNI